MEFSNQYPKSRRPKQSRFRYTPGLYSNSVTETSQTANNSNTQNEINNNNNNNSMDTNNNSTNQHQTISELSTQENSLSTKNNEKNYVDSVLLNFNSIETIQFSTGLSLDYLGSISWIEGMNKHIEFFTNKQVSVNLISIDDTPNLTQSLKNIIDGHPMAIDFEWEPDFSRYSANPISLFQIASSKGVLIILNSEKVIYSDSHQSFEFFRICPNLSILKEFFTSHSFHGKGMVNDKKKLMQLFGTQFNFEDIEKSRLKPNGFTRNFDQIIKELVGQPTAQFKDKSVSLSNWSDRPLTAKQVIYAAFDAYATRLIWEAFVTKYNQEEFIPIY